MISLPANEFTDLKFADALNYRNDLERAKIIGLAAIGVIISSKEDKKNIAFQDDVKIILTAEVDTSESKWMQTARKLRPLVDYLSAVPHSLVECREASKAKIIDSIVIKVPDMIFDDVCAVYLEEKKGFLEVPLLDLLSMAKKGINLGNIRREIEIAFFRKVPVIITRMRSPSGHLLDKIASYSVAYSLLGGSLDRWVCSVSTYPYHALERRNLLDKGVKKVEV
jgi:RNase P/RNase MRP subunit p30